MKIKTRRYNKFWGLPNYYFFEHKNLLIGFIGAFLIGVVVGIFSYVKFNKVFDFTIISQNTTVNVFFTKINFFSFAISSFLKYLLNIVIIFLLTLTIFTVPFSFLYTSYLGYTLGAGAVVIVSALSVGGILGMILFYLPFRLLIYFVLINIACVCQKKCNSNFRFGRKYKCDAYLGFNFKAFLVCLLVIFALCFLEALLMPSSIKAVLKAI